MGGEVLPDPLGAGVIGSASNRMANHATFDLSRDGNIRAPSTLERFRRALTARRDAFARWLGAAPGRAAPITRELDSALQRIGEGSFGECTECSGTVESSRLELDFTTSVCLEHYTEGEILELQNDLEWAAQVQRDLAPASAPEVPGFELAALSRPARVVGGDDLEFFLWRDGRHGIAVADVMGKGLPAGLLVSHLQASLRILGPEYETPDALAARLHEVFRYNLNVISFFTLLLVSLEPRTGTLTWCNAGHEPPLVRRAASGAVERLAPTGPAIGLAPEAAWEARSVDLASGDLVLISTDGLTEAKSPGGEVLDEERLIDCVRDHADPAALLATLKRELEQHAGGAPQDDLTLVALARR